MSYYTAGGEMALRSLPAASAIQNLPVAPRPITTAPRMLPAANWGLSNNLGAGARIAPAVGGAASAASGTAGAAAGASTAASTALAVAAGVAALGFGFAIGDTIAQGLGIEYPGGKNALQYFAGGGDPGIGALGAVSGPVFADFEGEAPFKGGQSDGVCYRVSVKSSSGDESQFTTRGPIGGVRTVTIAGGGRLEVNSRSIPTAPDALNCSTQFNPNWWFTGAGGTAWNADKTASITSIVRLDGQPDTGGDPEGTRERRPTNRTNGADLRTAPAAPAAPATPAAPTTPTTPTTPPGEPVNPPADKKTPGLPDWLYQLPYAMPAVTAGALGTPGVKPGPNTTPVNTPQPGDDGAGNTPPKKTRLDDKCRCNAPLFNKLDDIEKRLDRSLGAAGVAGDGGIFAYLVKMQQFAEKAWETTRMQKVLDVLTFIGVMHNVSMLSRNLGQTFLEVVGQGIQAVGIRDEENKVIDVNEVVSENVEGLLKNTLGVETYNGINQAWNKANRIISSASAVIQTIRSIGDSTAELMEWVAENTGRIGNGLKRWRVVGEKAYPDMSESAQAHYKGRGRFDKLTGTLTNAEDRLSVYEQATSTVIELEEETSELIQNYGEFRKSVIEGVPDPWADNQPIKEANDADKAASTAPNIEVSDSQKG